MGLALRVLDAHDQHVLGQPALGACLVAGDAQCVALLAKQRVAAVAGAVRLDRQLFGEMHDEAALWIQLAGGMQPFHEVTIALDARQCCGAHARHRAHVGDDIRTVGDFHAATRKRRIDRTHAVRDDVHRSAFHAAVEQCVDLGMRLGRRHPVIVWTGVGLVFRAYEREVFHARHIGRAGAMQIAARMGLLIQFDQIAGMQHLLYQTPIFGIGTVTPMDRRGAGHSRHVMDPLLERSKLACHVFPRLGLPTKKSHDGKLRVLALQGRMQQTRMRWGVAAGFPAPVPSADRFRPGSGSRSCVQHRCRTLHGSILAGRV